MKFEKGKYYSHEGGRQISIVAEVATDMWGKMLVVEEADKTGHGISCMEINEITDILSLGWIEIGKEEWLRNFEEATCDACGKIFISGDKFVPTDKGPLHVACFSAIIEERGPDVVETSIH